MFSPTVALLLCGLLAITQGESGGPSIEFKRLEIYEWVYDDKRSTAIKDLSVWRPLDREAGYCALGDVAVASHEEPTISTITVRGLKPGAVVYADRFKEIWNNRGSLGGHAMRILRMIPPAGYTCLGDVAVLGYDDSFRPPHKYCCVRSEFVAEANMEAIWNDRWSAASEDVSIWEVLKAGSLHGIAAANFRAVASYDRPEETPYLLVESDDVVNAMSRISVLPKPFHVYETSELIEVWRDAHTGAKEDVAFWHVNAPEGYFSLGDTARADYDKPARGYMVKPIEADSLRPPDEFRVRWNDRGSFLRSGVTIWEPVCPSGYRALGHVTKASYTEKPSKNEVRCVKGEYTIPGSWNFVWDDSWSRMNDDCTVWMAVSTSRAGQGVAAISAVKNHGPMDRPAYVLNASAVNYYSTKPVERYELKEVTYDLNARELVEVQPDVLDRTVVKNEVDVEQTVSAEFAYTERESSSWSNNNFLEIGVSATISAGIPIFGKAETHLSMKQSFTYTWGGQKDKTISGKKVINIRIPAKTQVTASMVARKYKAKLPYKATLVKHYTDGRTAKIGISGVYEGVNINEDEIVYEQRVLL